MSLTVPFRLPRGFRRIREDDIPRTFRTSDKRMNRVTLRDYYDYSRQKNQYVVLLVEADELLGIMAFMVCGDHIYLEWLARNAAISTEERVGSKLISLLEGIARQLEKYEIRLDSLDSSFSWYVRLGYQSCGAPFPEDRWGTLTPMRKRL